MSALERMLSCPDCRFLPGPLAETLSRLLVERGDGAVAEFLREYHAAGHDLTAVQDRREDDRG